LPLLVLCCAGPYANFGPLADLVDSVVADAAASAPAADGAAGSLLAFGPARISAAAAADEPGSSKGHVPHKVALGYMLLPDYVQMAALNRWASSSHGQQQTAQIVWAIKDIVKCSCIFSCNSRKMQAIRQHK
jgi:hypothetical protein